MQWSACRIAAAALICGCTDAATEPVDPGPPPGALARLALVSDPGTGIAAASTGAPASAHSGALEPVVWISLPPGSVPEGIAATIEHERTGATLRAEIVDGGFDPIAMPAVPGDTLVISVDLAKGGPESARIAIPARRRPRVVRTTPAAGRTDVAINASAAIVFSEPIASSSVDTAFIRILKGQYPVAGTVRLVAGSAVQVEFVPAAPLDPGTTYQLVLSAGIRDLSADSLEAPVTVAFTTATVPSGLPEPIVGVLALSARGIALYRADGTFIETLSDPSQSAPKDPFAHDFFPAWSPDGRRIAFARHSHDPGTGDIAEIFVMDANGANQRRISPAGGYASRPTWSPDGDRIAFQTRRDSAGYGGVNSWIDEEIYVMNADGSNPVRLMHDMQPDWAPDWSPDGSRIAFVTSGELGDADIFVMDADGTDRVNLTNDAGFDNDPDWSPDGSRIAFTKNGELFVMNADGTNSRRIDTPGAGVPKWSPDGRFILFVTYAACEYPDVCPGATATMVRISDGLLVPFAPLDGLVLGHWSWRP